MSEQQIISEINKLLDEINKLEAGADFDKLIQEALAEAGTTPEESGQLGGPTPTGATENAQLPTTTAEIDTLTSTAQFDKQVNDLLQSAIEAAKSWAAQYAAKKTETPTVRVAGTSVKVSTAKPPPDVPAEVYDQFLYITLTLGAIVEFLLQQGPTDEVKAIDIDRFIDDYISMVKALKDISRGPTVLETGE